MAIEPRREWRALSRDDKVSYLKAVKCLATKPSALKKAPVRRLYDDFAYVHTEEKAKQHWTASFLPWHRWFIHIYHNALKEQCGYQGPMTFWAWELDWEDIFSSTVWSGDAETGFGGNGKGQKDPVRKALAVTDGAFANWQLEWPQPHPLSRNFSTPDTHGGPPKGRYGREYLKPEYMTATYGAKTFQELDAFLEGKNVYMHGGTPAMRDGPHSIVHRSIGGDMIPQISSANDPIFYLHHANVDRIWAKWQDQDRANRARPAKTAYGGVFVQNTTDDNARLSDQLEFLELGAAVTAQSALDTRAPPFCYEYES